MYQQDHSGYYGNQYRDDDEESNQNQYGHNYRNYRMMNEPGIKGKIEQKYWKTKQKAIEKLGKDQDEFVIAGDAEVDARLEAFQHIKLTCMQLMAAIECFQNKIFALSQDENEMGRFLKDQGALDKTKAGKMMIAVGKAQSFAAQQRLGLRSSLARLYAEVETFRFRAIQDTQITVNKMEQSRSDYRARLLWMADISKELDPDQYKRLDKFRDVQMQVKAAKKLFDRLKFDVIQKIDLLSASRCNLLSATLEPYQTAMVKFLNTTAKSYNTVFEQYKGHPSYQFNILKNIIPNNGIVDDDEDDIIEEKKKKKRSRNIEKATEAKEESKKNNDSGNDEVERQEEDDDKLINFDSSPSEEMKESTDEMPNGKTDANLLGDLNNQSPGFGEYTDNQEKPDGFEDLLGKFEENNILSDRNSAPPSHQVNPSSTTSTDPFSLISDLDASQRESQGSALKETLQSGPGPSIDDLLFGSPSKKIDGTAKTDLDILSDVLSNQSLGITESEQNNSFSGQWQSMFGSTDEVGLDLPTGPPLTGAPSLDKPIGENQVDANIKSDRMYLPSFLLEEMRKTDPKAFKEGPPKGALSVKDSKTPPSSRKSKDAKGKDMSAWFNLFADLDPLANPDEVGASQDVQSEKQAC